MDFRILIFQFNTEITNFMTHKTSALLALASLLLFFTTSACHAGEIFRASASLESKQGGTPMAAAPEQTLPDLQGAGTLEVRPTEKDLSANAKETYSYLLMIQAILDEDEAAILDAAPLLKQGNAPANIWLDGGVWLVSRKSTSAPVYLEQALQAWPEDLSLNLLFAEALGEHGMADRGVRQMRAFLERHPDSLDAKLELALLLVKDKQFVEARKILGEIPAKQRNGLVNFYQAQALMGMDKRGEAIPYLRKALKEMPDFLEALAMLASACEQEGNYKEARNAYEKLQKLQFLPQEVGLRLISLSLKMKQPDKAVQYVKKGPDTLPFRLTAANLFLQSRHYLQAENILKQIAGKPDAPVEVYLLLADIVYEQRHNLNMALEWLAKVPENSPGADKAALLRVQLLAEAGRLGQALEHADKAAKLYPDIPDFADFRIRLLAREKKSREALKLAQEAVKKWPDNMTLAFLLGSLLDENGKKKEALAIMEDIIKKQPDHFQALNYVGFSLAEENRDLDRALTLLTRADELSPDQAYIIDSLAWALYRAGKYEEALRQIRRAVKPGDATGDAAIWDHYGDIAKQRGLREEARKAYRKALELKPANAEEIRKKLSGL